MAHTPFQQQADITVRTNYFGTLAVTQAMLPLLRASTSSPRVVNVASAAGRLRGSQEIQDAFTSYGLDVPVPSSLTRCTMHYAHAHAPPLCTGTMHGYGHVSTQRATQALSLLMDTFVRDVEGGVHAENGWPNTCYGERRVHMHARAARSSRLRRGECRQDESFTFPLYAAQASAKWASLR